MVHQPQLVVGEGAPGVVDLHGAGGLPADRVALVHGDATEVVLELLHGVEHLSRPTVEYGVQAPARDRQQGKPGPNLLIPNADIASLIKRHCSSSPLPQVSAFRAILAWALGLSRQRWGCASSRRALWHTLTRTPSANADARCYPLPMEHEIPKSTSPPCPAPSRSTPARSASTTMCGSAPESRRLFLTGAKPGTKFCSWNESTSYDHPTKQPRAATPGREATPGPTAPAAPASYKDLRPLRWGSRKRQSTVRKGD